MGLTTRFTTRVLAEVAVLVALSTVLFYFKLYTFPQGGEVTFGSMTPILLLSLRRGVKAGVIAGVVFSFIVLALEPFVYYPAQFFLDYPLAFGALGLAGLFKGRGGVGAVAGVAVGIGGRFVCHFLSGVIFFANYAAEYGYSNAYIYSAVYNASYLIPELAISVTAILGLARVGLVETKTGQGPTVLP
jgi:thiamine transporter